MALWNVVRIANPRIKTPIFIEGMPGIGNVGKIAIDFIISELKAKKIYSFHSHTMPNSVFVTEDNLIELPRIEMYHKRLKSQDLLLLTGDVQPTNEVSCYEFSEKLLDILGKYSVKEIVTLGGIGLREVPPNPQVYCTGNSKKIIARYKKAAKINPNVFGVVGPIVGVSGLLLGLAKKVDIEAISLLAETLGHPMYLGIKGAREITAILNKKLALGLDIKKIDKEIKEIESQITSAESLGDISGKIKSKKIKKYYTDLNYIG